MIRSRRALVVAASVIVALGFGGAAGAADAKAELKSQFKETEFAIRWQVTLRDQKPVNDAEWVKRVLLPAFGKDPEVGVENYKVQYFNWTYPADHPKMPFREIMRQRAKTKIKKKGPETTWDLMYKQRADDPFAVAANACPLPAGPNTEDKYEIDASYGPEGAFKPAYSYSCTQKGQPNAIAPPSSLPVKVQTCSTDMERIEIEGRMNLHDEPAKDDPAPVSIKVKVETWKSTEGVMVEVSASKVSDADFKSLVVDRLMKDGQVVPITDPKTQLAGKCPAVGSTAK